MIINWLKRILGFSSFEGTTSNDKLDVVMQKPSADSQSNWEEEMDKRIASILQDKKNIHILPTDWYHIEPNELKRNEVKAFKPYSFVEVVTLRTLKEERLKKEAHERKAKEDKLIGILETVSTLIGSRNVSKAQLKLEEAYAGLVELKNDKLAKVYSSLCTSLETLKSEIEAQRLAKLAEQQKREREERQRRLEAEEKARLERERQERIERQRREAEAQKRFEAHKRKEEAERAERQRLERLSSEKKEDWEDYLSVLKSNGIMYLYHFTDVRNLASIKRHGGLFSWDYCDNHGITIPCQGGDYDSRNLDVKYGLQDYVRLSFCDDHPMAWRLKQTGSDIKVLRIRIDVALLKNTLYSDMNAADSRHTHGGSLTHLNNVDFDAVKRRFVRSSDPDFKPHQAEVMVKTFIPLKYIENL